MLSVTYIALAEAVPISVAGCFTCFTSTQRVAVLIKAHWGPAPPSPLLPQTSNYFYALPFCLLEPPGPF